jgi:hypothetical protein
MLGSACVVCRRESVGREEVAVLLEEYGLIGNLESAARWYAWWAYSFAIVPCLVRFLPVLVDRRRRALQDFVAGTVVPVDDFQQLPVEPIAELAQARSSPLS